jgi:hypothetical protein
MSLIIQVIPMRIVSDLSVDTSIAVILYIKPNSGFRSLFHAAKQI